MGSQYFVIDSKVLPEIFTVIQAKDLLRSGEEYSSRQNLVGISRSAFYKYKIRCFRSMKTKQVVTIALL